jgi:DeoR/GlpR family transcriptional regulator of sugar metabolism
LFAIERHGKVLDYINERKKASVKELSQHFRVSKVTIRRDLDELVRRGLVIKTHGGALSLDNSFSSEIPYEKKFMQNVEAKKKIGLLAARMVEPDDVIILDAGSTTLEIAAQLRPLDEVTVITNDLKIAVALAHKPGVQLMVTGGVQEKGVYTLTGSTAEEFLSKIRAKKTFLGADAISLEYGITNRTFQEVSVKRCMMKAADEVILVADHSKFDKKVFAFLCELQEVDQIIVDRMEPDLKTELTRMGIKVTVADEVVDDLEDAN